MSTPTALTVAENTNKKKFSLTSSDGETFEVEEAEVIQSQMVKDMIEDIDSDGSIPLPNVSSKILAKVIEYCKFHAGDAVEDSGLAFKSNQSEENVKSKWDKDFVKGIEDDQEVLFDVILAANYLNIKGLLDLTCNHVADMIKGKTPSRSEKSFISRMTTLKRKRRRFAVRISGLLNRVRVITACMFS